MLNAADKLQAVRDYHTRSKHRFEAYAAGPDTLDWDEQPEPFRWYEGAGQLGLPLLADALSLSFATLYRRPAIGADRTVFERLSMLLERSLGLAAWKNYGPDRWALRCNPSSGNLHPTEAYVVTPGGDGLDAGVYHYLSRDHLLEQRCRLEAGALSAFLPGDGFLVGLSSVHWREAWKYGERAYRYCQHDCGHAIAALSYAGAALGLSVRVLEAWGDADIARALGLDRDDDFGAAEREHPDAILWVGEADARGLPAEDDITSLVEALAGGSWHGRANCLSAPHRQDWPVIEEIAAACRKPRTPATGLAPAGALPEFAPTSCEESAMALFRQRRSAQAFDGRTAISAQTFYRMLDMTLPRAGVAPWDSVPWAARVHLVVFVHRVEGLRPGLYVFARSASGEALLRERVQRAEFQWQPVGGCPSHLALSSLVFANCQRTAATLSCHQAIAGDSAFSLGMLAEFDAALETAPWHYRQLFWEAGMLGQVLYLEAEAAGVRGTGIGCYFDDPVHDLLGLADSRLQSLYHFTVGGALVDQRITTTPPYGHLESR